MSWWPWTNDPTQPVEQANNVVYPTPVPVTQNWLSGLQDFASQVGAIFDSGYDIYSRLAGRIKADRAIENETLDEPVITVGHTVDLDAFYRQNRTVVWVFVGGVAFIGVALLIKKR